MNEERWIEVSLESYEMSRRLRDAIQVAYQVHVWAMDLLKSHWMDTMQVLTINEMQPMMTYWLRERGLEEKAQRYALDASLAQTAIYFNNGLRLADTGRRDHNPSVSVLIPPPAPEKEWNSLEIQSRQIWRKYLEDFGRLTTAYGTLFLEGEWPEEMRGYAEDLGVRLELVPALWQSITIKEVPILDDEPDPDAELWMIRFNFFKPDSFAGKKRAKKGKMYAEEPQQG